MSKQLFVTLTWEDVLAIAKDNPNVQSDNLKAERLRRDGFDLCQRCGGTGNEFLFMFKQCSDCEGTGIDSLITGTIQ